MPFRFLCSVMLGNGPFLNPREVMPLAVLHFENTVLVASCAFLLKLCGLSASMLHVDVAALWRISSFYKSTNYQERPVALGCSGDGTEFRHQKKVASQHRNLATAFCQMHHLPQSTNYLAILANDNDWVGFLTEAQTSVFPFDMVIQLASKEFTVPPLNIHIITVLKIMQLSKEKASSTNLTPMGNGNEMTFRTESNPVELFGLLAECEEGRKNPGEELLIRAKNFRWSLLAVVPSYFPDVSSLSFVLNSLAREY